jgi:hypothetical protein
MEEGFAVNFSVRQRTDIAVEFVVVFKVFSL